MLAHSAHNPWWYSDVTGVEIAGALKNVLAIAAGIVEGMNLGNNSMAALVAQGCSEIRWLATKVSWLSYPPWTWFNSASESCLDNYSYYSININ